MSDDTDDTDDIDILYEEMVPLSPGTPAFLYQQLHLLENLQKNQRSNIPVDYQEFLECVKSLKTSYQPAVTLATWKMLLDKHLLILGIGEQQNSNIPLLKESHKNKSANKKKDLNATTTDSEILTKTNMNLKVTKKLTKVKAKEHLDCDSKNFNSKEKIEDPSLHNKKRKHNKINETSKDNESQIFSTKCKQNNTKVNPIVFEMPKTTTTLLPSYSQSEDENGKNKSEIFTEEIHLLSSNLKISCDSEGTKKKRKSSLKRKSQSDKKCSSSAKKKKSKRTSLEDLCSSVLSNSYDKKLKKIDQSDLKECGISKSELIKFLKEQKKEKDAEEKILDKQILELFHDRLVDVILTNHFEK